MAQARARIAELERELTEQTAAKAAPRDNKDDRIAKLEEEIQGLRFHIRFGPKRRAAEPKAEKPPLPPDEERERIIKGLRTRVRNLTAELNHTHAWYAAKRGIMSRQTRIAIDKVLHNDTRNNASEAERDAACKGWNVWKNESDKAGRRES